MRILWSLVALLWAVHSTVDPTALVAAVADFGANTFLMNMGGIVAQYPTRVPFHHPSVHLPPGRDLFGDVLREAHARKIRVIGRFDLSKTQRPVFEAHPEWFFRRANGDPVIYNGLGASSDVRISDAISPA